MHFKCHLQKQKVLERVKGREQEYLRGQTRLAKSGLALKLESLFDAHALDSFSVPAGQYRRIDSAFTITVAPARKVQQIHLQIGDLKKTILSVA